MEAAIARFTQSYDRLSSRKRKHLYIRLKNKVRQAFHQHGQDFVTCDLSLSDGSIAFWFIGKGRKVYFCSLQTTRHAYRALVGTTAWNNANARLPDPRVSWGPVESLDLFLEKSRAPEGARLEFDGMERWDWIRQEERRIAETLSLSVREQTTLHHNYAECIGVQAILDVPVLTTAAVNSFIRGFIADGEKPRTGAAEFSYKHEQAGPWALDMDEPFEAAALPC